MDAVNAEEELLFATRQMVRTNNFTDPVPAAIMTPSFLYIYRQAIAPIKSN